MSRRTAAVVGLLVVAACGGPEPIVIPKTTGPATVANRIPPTQNTYFLEGEGDYLVGRFDKAITSFQRFIATATDDPRLPEAHYWLGRSCLAKGDAAAALPPLREAEKTVTGETLTAQTILALSEAHYLLADFPEAARYGMTALERHLNQVPLPDVLLKTGLACIRINERKRGEEILKRLIQAFPGTDQAELAQERLEALENDFTVQLAAFSSSEKAQEYLDKITLKGQGAHLKALHRDGKVLYSVRLGSYPTWFEADAVAKELKEKGYEKAFALP
ncbi:MAG: SPOR domain-containing protein [Planctomycetota bacterium]